ncbi:MAG: hypothetical protein OXT65_00430 [Alphaproteobacteria bacterium]|nr:hypothetical protein [Alphaproteobacteria bacterium]
MKTVQMRLQATTIDKIRNKLKPAFNAKNETDAIVTSLEIAEEVVDVLKNGGEVRFVAKDGTTERLIVPGLNK